MKRFFKITSLVLSGYLFVFIGCVWAFSYHAPHSLRYSRASGEVQVLTDRGIFQIDLVRGDTEDRGVEWDAHRRSAGWGRAELDMFKPQAGPGRLLAEFGFASWSYDRVIHGFFSPPLSGRIVFIPFWLLALVAVAPALCGFFGGLTGRWSNQRPAVDAGTALHSESVIIATAPLRPVRWA